MPDEAELERLGVYDPSAADAGDRLKLLRHVFELGATPEDVVAANRVGSLGDLALDLAIRPPGGSPSLDAFLEDSGLDPGAVRRLWRALGFPDPAPMPFPVTPDLSGALRLLLGLSDIVGEPSALAVARVIASSAVRVAESISGAFRIGVEAPQRAGGMPYSEVVAGYTAGTRELLPLFLDSVAAVVRRHLVLVSYQHWFPDEEQAAVTLELSVGFADLVGSTAAVRAGSPAQLTRMVREFEEQVWDLVAAARGRVVKLIGDEAMFVVEEPAAACAVAATLVASSPNPVRVGLAHGPVVALFGDYYGITVNLAARLVSAADPSTVLVSDSVRVGAPDMTFEATAPQALRGFPEPVVAYRLSATR